MPKKRLTDAQLRQHINQQQADYRRRNPAICEIWKQRSYANHLRKYGWKVEPPPGFPTLEQARDMRDLMRARGENPIDLVTDLVYETSCEKLFADKAPKQTDEDEDILPW